MINYMRGELYRLLHKKSLYLYFGALALGYALVAFVRSGGFGEDSLLGDASNFFGYLPALAGGFLFAAVYTDDLGAKSLATLVGFGMGKTKIVLSKLLLMALSGAMIFALVPLLHCGVYAALGCAVNGGALGMIYALALQALLATLGYAALAGVMVYGLQRATFAFVLYILLAFGIVGGLLATVLKMFLPNVGEHLLSGITLRIFSGVTGGGPLALPIIEYAVYAAAAAALSAIAFNKKEMEF